MAFTFLSTIFCLELIDYQIVSILKPYMNSEVERLTNNIVNQAIRNKIKNANYSFNKVNQNENSKLFSYDTIMLTKIKDEITAYVQDSFIQLDNGKIDEYFISDRIKTGRFKKVKHGVICDLTLGSVRGSTLFANVGPAIPIKLSFLGQIQSDIDVDIKEYGINNVLVTIYLIINVKEQISMPFSSDKVDIKVREPIVIDLVQGNIPHYFYDYLKLFLL